ncbi:hypothetical protein C8F01DRAFT_754487 [Mycena amicta]|nr:hypothetical protein C8F01DRAFT_754487 [Mycena amicta]
MLGLHLSAPPITLPTTYSRMTALGLALTSPISSHVSGTILAVILSSLTLPCVTSMEFEPNPYFKHQLLPWPHVAFIGVAQRSDFASHLRELHIRWIAIKDTELVEVLKALPGLETLGLGDDFPISTPVHPASSSSSSSSEDSSSDEDNSSSDEDNSSSDEDIDIAPRVIEPANPPLLSHMLLCRLSQLAEDTHELIPHLKIFNYASQMNFDHTEFLAFVSTRAIASIPRKGLEPFTVELEWLAPDKSALPPVDLDFHLNDHLQELVNRRKLRYSFRVCGPESW